MRVFFFGALMATGLGGCFFGGDKNLSDECLEPQPYQSERLGNRVAVPEDLDPLDSLKEMPIPEAQTPPRDGEAGCLTAPPSIR